MARPALPRKPCIARYGIDLREIGWPGATITCLASHKFPRLLINLSLTIAAADQRSPDCSGAKMCGRRAIFGRGAGFSARLAWSISSHLFRFGSRLMGLLAAMECRR